MLATTISGILISGCATPSMLTPPSTTTAYEAREPIGDSLFPSDRAVLPDEAVARILASKLELPTKAKLALMKFPDSEGSRTRNYWRDEHFLKLQQVQVETLTDALNAAAGDLVNFIRSVPKKGS